MSAIIIKADDKSIELIKELAKKLGANVVDINDEQYEDILLGSILDSEKSEDDVTREEIFKKLKRK